MQTNITDVFSLRTKTILLVIFSSLHFCEVTSQVWESKLNELIDEAIPLIDLSSSERLKNINIQIDNYWESPNKVVTDSLRIKYYNYKGGLAIRRWEPHQAIEYYNKVKLYSTSDQDMFRYNLGVGVAYQLLNHYDEAEKKLLESLEYAVATNITNNIALSLSELANLYRVIRKPELEQKYIDECLLLNRQGKNCELLKANFNVDNGKLGQGLQELWEIVIFDPEFKNLTTVYAVLGLIENYIDASGIDKAEKLINILLEKRNQLHNGIISNLVMKQGLIFKKRGDTLEAERNFINAMNISAANDFQNEIWLEIYLLDANKKRYNDLNSLAEPKLVPEYVINGSTGNFIKIISTIQESSNVYDLENTIKSINNSDVYSYARKEPRKLSLVFEEIKSAAIIFKDFETFSTYTKKSDSLFTLISSEQQKLTNHFFNAQLSYYENQILSKENSLAESNRAFDIEREINKTYLIYLSAAVIALLTIFFLFIQTILSKKKNQKLLLALEDKNIELKAYAHEYETMLLVLSHHVKKPINQLFYSFESIKSSIAEIADDRLNFLVSNIADSTTELSDRVSTVLTLLELKINRDKEFLVDQVNLGEIIQIRLITFKKIQYKYVDTTNGSELNVLTNKAALIIVIDNVLENYNKHSTSGKDLCITISDNENFKGVEFINAVDNKNILEVNQKPTRDSFGLGQQIIKRLCDQLNIQSEVVEDQETYSIKLHFIS